VTSHLIELLELTDAKAVYQHRTTGQKTVVYWCLHKGVGAVIPLSMHSMSRTHNRSRRLKPGSPRWAHTGLTLRADVGQACKGIEALFKASA